jgi:hypothetical protein
MVESGLEFLLERLRDRLSRLLGAGSRSRVALALREVRTCGHPTYLFGSVLRNLLLKRPHITLRDVDVVVGASSIDDISRHFAAHVKRPTRFGGLHLEIHGMPIDLWPLNETWALRTLGGFSCDFDSLPKTTFLDIEAVTAELFPSPGKPRIIHSHGFFKSLQSRCVDINLEENPFPDLCVVRAFLTAVRLRFSIGRRLAGYLLHHCARIPLEELVATCRHHYRHVHIVPDDFRQWIRAAKMQYRTTDVSPIELWRLQPLQLTYWAQPSFCEIKETAWPLFESFGGTREWRCGVRRVETLECIDRDAAGQR